MHVKAQRNVNLIICCILCIDFHVRFIEILNKICIFLVSLCCHPFNPGDERCLLQNMTKINKRRVAKPKAQSPVAKSAKENVEPSPARRSLRQSVSRHRVSYRFSSTESDENDDESSEFEANSESEDEAWDDELLPLTELKVTL